jgi:hypothetical protein
MLAIHFRTGDLGKNMRKRAKGRKTETLTLPMAGKVAVVVIAVGGLGCGLLSRPASIQPVRVPSARQACFLRRQFQLELQLHFPFQLQF